MTPEVKERIDQLRHRIVPEGYKKTKAGIVPEEWTEYTIANCLKRVERPVEVKSDEMYTQIGIRSHGKGLFYKEPVNGTSLGNKSVFWIEPDCFVLNIVFAWEQAIGKTTQKEVGMIGSHRFPMYRPINERVDVDYLISYLMTKRGKDILEAASPGGAGRNRTLGQDRFMNSKIVLPTLTEQKKIASILTMQDKIIELEQQKIEEIKKAKRFFLEKMFPKEGQPVPEIRFKGFTAPWEQRKFSEVFSFLQNNTLSRADLSEESGAAKNVHYGDVLIKFGEYLDVKKVHLAFIPTEAVANKYKASFLQNGDIIIADTAEDETVGKCCEIANSEGNALVSGLHTMPCRPNQKYASGFLGYYMNSPAYHDQLLPLMQGTKVTSVSKTAISDTQLMYPVSVDEQRRISQYLLSIDNLITLHQRELAEVEKYKKALMQLLLTGLVRVNA